MNENEKKMPFEPAKIEVVIFDGDDIICESTGSFSGEEESNE